MSFHTSFLAGAIGWGLLLALGVIVEESNAQAPNILCIVADDQRADAIGAQGNPDVSTPNIDDLFKRGFAFNNAYNFGADSGAVCQPSRAMFLTGRTLWNVCSKDLSGATTLPEAFRSAGYITFGTGKWHNGQSSFVRSFDQGKHIFFGGCTGCSNTSNTDNDVAKNVVFNTTVQNLGPEGTFCSVTASQHGHTHLSTLFADATIEFIANHSRESSSPFFAYLSFTACHDPRVSPEPYDSMYRDENGDPTVPLPDNFKTQLGFDQGEADIRDEVLIAIPRQPEDVREEIADYYGMISHMDAEIGRVLKALDANGQLENTIVVYHADQGLALGSHGLLGKQNPYEHSIKAPMVMAGPGIPHGSSDALVYLHDLFPTLVAMANDASASVTLPDEVEGRNLDTIVGGEKKQVREVLFCTYKNYQKVLRRGNDKLIYFPHINKVQLFDLAADPCELNDLSGNPDKTALMNELAKLLRQEQVAVGDPNLVGIKLHGLLEDPTAPCGEGNTE